MIQPDQSPNKKKTRPIETSSPGQIAELTKKFSRYTSNGESIWLNNLGTTIEPDVLYDRNGCIIVPFYNFEGYIVNRLRVADEGNESLLGGYQNSKIHHTVETSNIDKIIFVTDNFLTGLALHAVTGSSVSVCFNLGNLGNVVGHLRKNHANSVILAARSDKLFSLKPDKNTSRDFSVLEIHDASEELVVDFYNYLVDNGIDELSRAVKSGLVNAFDSDSDKLLPFKDVFLKSESETMRMYLGLFLEESAVIKQKEAIIQHSKPTQTRSNGSKETTITFPYETHLLSLVSEVMGMFLLKDSENDTENTYSGKKDITDHLYDKYKKKEGVKDDGKSITRRDAESVVTIANNNLRKNREACARKTPHKKSAPLVAKK